MPGGSGSPRRESVGFVVLAATITWLLVLPLVLDGIGLVHVGLPSGYHAVGALGPFLAATMLIYRRGGRPGVASFLGRLGRWRLPAGWLFVAVGTPFVIFAVGVTVAVVLDPSPVRFPAVAALGAQTVGAAVLSAVAYGVGEEVGWRGYLLPRLQTGRSALRATTLLTVAWGVWHAPFFLYRFDFGPVTLVGFLVGLYAGAIWLTALFNGTWGSVFAVAAWHTGWNLVNQYAVHVSETVVAVMTTTVMVLAVVVVIVWRPATLAPFEPDTHEPPTPD